MPLLRRISGCLTLLMVTPTLAVEVNFNRDIRPILSENCFFCHGPDPETREAGLRLDDRDVAIEVSAIVPEEPESSELLVRILHNDPELKMPPPESHKSLDDDEIALLRDWVEQGAEYEPHWAFTPIERPAVPETDSAAHPVDAFIRQKLIAEGLKPSPPARPDRLLRRLMLDLTGLPPTWAQVQAFVSAFEKNADAAVSAAIDEQLRSPHHGERMAAIWLDLVRYADTVGYHGDQNQNIFPYRDWVIDSYNRNRPFDEFTISQLAGDLLPDRTTDDLVASGFNRLNMMTREGGAQPQEYLTKYDADRVRAVGMAWMGLTTGCAECHDHKFDPLTTKDFYSLAAYFADLEQWGVYSDYGYSPNADLKGFNNDFPFPPEIEVRSEPLLRRQAELTQQLASLAKQLSQRDDLAKAKIPTPATWWTTTRDWLDKYPTGWCELPWTAPAIKADKRKAPSTTLLVSAADGRGDTDFGAITSLRLSLATSLPFSGAKLAPKFFVQTGTEKRRELVPLDGQANRWSATFQQGQVVENISRAWTLPATDADGRPVKTHRHEAIVDRATTTTDPMTAVFQFHPAITLTAGQRLIVELGGWAGSDRDRDQIWLAKSPLGWMRPHDPTELDALRLAGDAGEAAVAWSWMMSHRSRTEPMARAESLVQEIRQCRDGRARTMVSGAIKPRTIRVLPRGNWQDESNEPLLPAPPEFLGHVGSDESSSGAKSSSPTDSPRQTRLDLARWIVHPDNPLTARVVANRLWKQFFGSGLTIAADDLGAQGDPPSHPELLDYLASELIVSGWDQQHVMRLILTSQTYRQDSRRREELVDVDPDNRWLAYHPPRRLEAELVRDHALAVSGLMQPHVGGPSVKPYQPAGYYSNLQFPDRDYVADQSRDQYRRGIYMHWQRTFLHPMLANFDAPSREDCVAIRAVANTPQQALTLLNDPSFVEAASELAFLLLTDAAMKSDEDRLRAMIHRTLQRDATSDELERLAAFLDSRRRWLAEHPDQVTSLAEVGWSNADRDWDQLDSIGGQSEWAAWTLTARIVLNLHEAITRY